MEQRALKQETDSTEWIISPVIEPKRRLQPMQELLIKPFSGPQRRLRIFRNRVLIGRSSECDLRIEDPFMSPCHAELRISEDGHGYHVYDLSSRNGVFLNGVRVMSAPLPAQGSLRLGRSFLSWASALPPPCRSGNGYIFADPEMMAITERLRKLAPASIPVLLLGETGTGKDVLARLLHDWSEISSGPFVPVNGALMGGDLADSELFGHRKGAFTGAIQQRLGALRSAHGGTLFLDEIADMPLSTQVKLLRSIETGEVRPVGADRAERAEFRLVTATSRDLDAKVRNGDFRIDLYFRIAGVVIHVPPLRQRPLDISAISRKLLQARNIDLDEEAEKSLLSYSWPGNVRELRSVLERAMLLASAENASRLLPEHLLGFDFQEKTGPRIEEGRPVTWEEHERRVLKWALERNGWSRVATSKELGIARSSLFLKIKRYGLSPSMTQLSRATPIA